MRLVMILCLFLSSCVAIPGRFQVTTGENTSLSPAGEEAMDSLEIYTPYVGQGDATLARTPSGKTLLIDAGPPSAGRDDLLPLLESLNLKHLDILLITHYDLDHLGGVPGLLSGRDGQLGTSDDISIGEAWDRGGSPYDSSPGLIPYLEALQEKQIPRHAVELGQSLDLDADLDIRVVAVNGKVWNPGGDPVTVDLTPETLIEKENAASIALLLEYGDFRYLTAGDLTGGGMLNGFLTPDVESPLADAVGEVDVLHANHHGSASSSNPYFVAKTSPEAVIIQAGVGNPYGHPNGEVMKKWEGTGASLYFTEGKGFLLETKGEEVNISAKNLDAYSGVSSFP